MHEISLKETVLLLRQRMLELHKFLFDKPQWEKVLEQPVIYQKKLVHGVSK